MSILGSLIVNLTANTASFVEGMSGAGKTAKTVGHDIEETFSGLGGAVEKALAPFGEIGALAGEGLGKLGETIGNITGSFAKFGLTTKGVASGAIAIGAALFATEAGAVGLAIHTALAAAELGEMSQRTGVSTRTLAGLQIAAKSTGVSTEGLAKALQFMNANAVKAAIAPEATMTAFKRLGVEVTDGTHKMRDGTQIFLDLVGKIATLPQPEQGYFVKAIFGKGGAEIIPLMNLGRERLAELAELAKQVGLGDPQQIAAAQKFKEVLTNIQVEFEGIGLRLTKDLLPALTFLAERISNAFQAGTAQAFIDGLASVIKATVAIGDAFYALNLQVRENGKLVAELLVAPFVSAYRAAKDFYEGVRGLAGTVTGVFQSIFVGIGQQAYSILGTVIDTISKVFSTIGSSIWNVVSGVFEKMGAAFSVVAKVLHLETISDAFSKWGTNSKKIWTDSASFISGVFAPQKLLPLPTPGSTQSNLARTGGEKDTVLDKINVRLQALRQEMADWQALGNAGSQAEALIAEATKKGNEEFGKLRAEAARDKTGKASTVVIDNEALIKAAGAESVYGAAVKSLTTDLDKQGLKFAEQDKAAVALSAAYQQGGAAIAGAAIGKQFAEQAAKLSVLVQVHDTLAAKLGAENPMVEQLGTKVASLTAMLNANEAAAHKAASHELNAELEKQVYNFTALTPQVQRLNDAYLQSEDSVRRSRIELELHKFQLDEEAKGIVVTAAMLDTKRKILESADRQGYEGALAQEAARFSLSAIYDQDITKLSRLREVIQQSGQSTLLIDAAMYDAQNRLIQQWDQAAIKVGSFSLKTKAIFNELLLQGREAGAKIAQAFVSAFDGAETELARLIVTGKGNFLGVLQSLEESVVKAGIQKTLGGLLGGIPGLNKIPGLTSGAQLGSGPSNPIYAFMVNGTGTSIGAGPIPTGSEGGGIGGPNLTGLGSTAGPLSVGGFVQGLNTMSAAQTAFAGRFNLSWIGIGANFLRHILVMTGLYHAHTASVVASQAAQAGAVAAGQAAQTAAASSGAGARSNIGFAEHLSAIFRHAAHAAAAAFSKVFDALPFPINAIVAPIAAAGAFAGVLAWGALGGKARKGGLLEEDGPIFAHSKEMILPANISEGFQKLFTAMNQGGNVPSVQQFSTGSVTGGANAPIHIHMHQGAVHAVDHNGVRDVMRKGATEQLKNMRRMFQTGYLNPRKLARI